MRKDDVIEFFGGRVAVLAAVFTPPISTQTIYKWETVPEFRQIQLEMITGGALKADEGLIPDYRIKRQQKDGKVRFVKVKR